MNTESKQIFNRLWGTRVYLIGAMDRVVDGGVVWRRNITPFLEDIGVVVLNPANKPIGIGREDIEDRDLRTRLKAMGQYDELAKAMRLLRIIDLGMVDMSDFLICNIDVDSHACGTYEEFFWSNRMKTPILVHVEQGRDEAPDWLWGTIPHEHIFGEWDVLKSYVKHIDEDEGVDHMKRWMFFDYCRMMPKVPPRHQPDFKAWVQ